MWWRVESHDAARLLMSSDRVGVLTLVWHRHHTCGLGYIFSFLPQTGKRLKVNHVVVHQYLPYSVCHTGILVIVGEKRAVLEWPFFFRSERKELPGSFFALWAFSEVHSVFFCMNRTCVGYLPVATMIGVGCALSGWCGPKCNRVHLSKIFLLQSIWLISLYQYLHL